MRRGFLGLGLAVLCLLNGGPAASAPAAACASPPPELGSFRPSAAGAGLPAAVYIDAAGTERPIAALRGTPLVVNFWATWCAPCVQEMPALDRLAERARPGGIAVLTLSADREGATVVRKFFEVNGIRHLPVAVDKLSRVARAVRIDGLPTTLLYDDGGNEVGRVVGVAEWDAPVVHAFLARCLKGAV